MVNSSTTTSLSSPASVVPLLRVPSAHPEALAQAALQLLVERLADVAAPGDGRLPGGLAHRDEALVLEDDGRGDGAHGRESTASRARTTRDMESAFWFLGSVTMRRNSHAASGRPARRPTS